MSEILVLLVLALGLSVVLRAIDELVPFRAPAALSSTVAVAAGAGLAWLLGYSVFAAFGQELRAEWMHPVFTGLALVAVGQFIRSLVSATAHRTGKPSVEAEPAPRSVEAV